jgi:hypothetical protein
VALLNTLLAFSNAVKRIHGSPVANDESDKKSQAARTGHAGSNGPPFVK